MSNKIGFILVCFSLSEWAALKVGFVMLWSMQGLQPEESLTRRSTTSVLGVEKENKEDVSFLGHAYAGNERDR